MKILVIGGMHGNEPLGIAVAKLYMQKPVDGVDVMLANEQAIAGNCRYIKQDLNRTFPGDINSNDYEKRRAAKMLELCKKYDLVLDFHNTYCPDNDCGFMGEDAGRSIEKAALALGLKRMIIADYDCLNKYAANCLSIEISMGSHLNSPGLWYDRIKRLSREILPAEKSGLEKYRFVYRITLEDRDRLGLEKKSLKAFRSIDPTLAKKMLVDSPAYPIFIGDKLTPYNYGGLLNKIDPK